MLSGVRKGHCYSLHLSQVALVYCVFVFYINAYLIFCFVFVFCVCVGGGGGQQIHEKTVSEHLYSVIKNILKLK